MGDLPLCNKPSPPPKQPYFIILSPFLPKIPPEGFKGRDKQGIPTPGETKIKQNLPYLGL